MAVEPDQPAGMFLAGIIAVDQRDLVTMTHGSEGREQFGAEDRVYAFQHQLSSLKRTLVSSR
ncbi:hypothetical protein D3C87_1478720 [compost metagenome]